MSKLEALKELLAKLESGAHWSGHDVKEALGQHLQKRYWEALSGSLDAAKALHEAVLPDWLFKIAQLHNGTIYGRLVHSVSGESIYSDRKTKDPARAWLIAILKSLISIEEQKA